MDALLILVGYSVRMVKIDWLIDVCNIGIHIHVSVNDAHKGQKLKLQENLQFQFCIFDSFINRFHLYSVNNVL